MTATRKRLLLIAKALFGFAVVAAVGWHFWRLLSANPLREGALTLRWEYLLPAGLLYLAAHTIWGTFFYQLLQAQSAGVSWGQAVRAYFVSQAGKYVPGKAWVIVLRMVMLRGHGVTPTIVGVAGVYETLTSMAAGAMIGAALLPWSGLAFGVGSWEWLGVAGVALLPVGAVLLNRLAARLARRYRGGELVVIPKPPYRLLVQGLAQAAVGWVLLGASLYLTLLGLTTEPLPLDADSARGFVAANAISYIAGFVAIILPGGLGAREELLQRMLAVQLRPALGETAVGFAVVASLVLRLVWTAFEATLSLFLWFLGRPRRAAAPTAELVTSKGAHG